MQRQTLRGQYCKQYSPWVSWRTPAGCGIAHGGYGGVTRGHEHTGSAGFSGAVLDSLPVVGNGVSVGL